MRDRKESSHAPTESLLRQWTRLLAIRDQLEECTRELHRQVADLEDENARLYDELQQIRRSRGRQSVIAMKRALTRIASVLGHPKWAVEAAIRRAAWAPGATHIRNACRRACVGVARFRGQPFLETSAQTDVTEAIRWIGPVRISGRSLDALFAHPNSRIVVRVQSVPGAQVVCPCGIVPDVWTKTIGALDFRVTARVERTGWERRRSVRLDPGRQWSDRRWVDLVVPLPFATAEDVVVTLETLLAPGATHEFAWALWGDPRVEWRRSAREIRRAVMGGVARARRLGVRAVLDDVRMGDQAQTGAARYQKWLEQHEPTADGLSQLRADAARLPWRPLISVITPTYNTDPHWLRACIESVTAQVYDNWELCLVDDASTNPDTVRTIETYAGAAPRIKFMRLEENGHISAASNAALALAQGEFVAFLDHDDELAPEALFEVVRYLNAHPEADLIYSDEDKLDLAGQRCDPYFKPDWSPEHFLTCMYTCHLMVARRSVIEEIGGFRVGYEGAQDYDLVLRLMERLARIQHIPKILYHWRKLPESTAAAGQAKPWAIDAGRRALEDYVRRRGLAAEVLPGGAPGLYRVRHKIIGEPLVSIVIPTSGRLRMMNGRQVDLLAHCVRSIAQKTIYQHYEIVVVTDGAALAASSVEALRCVSRSRVVQFEAEVPFNFSRKMNFGVARAEGEHVVLFNDDLEAITSEWMTAMLEFSQQEAVGAVGAKLLYPDGRLQHVGMVLGVNGIAAHAFHQHPGSSLGYASSTTTVRNYSAVTAACLMLRRTVFDEVGGFNEDLAVDFNDVDLCLRIREAGFRIVFTPYAQLYHHESASFGPRVQNPREIERMRELWGAKIDHDPYYNPNLTRDYPDYRIDVPNG